MDSRITSLLIFSTIFQAACSSEDRVNLRNSFQSVEVNVQSQNTLSLTYAPTIIDSTIRLRCSEPNYDSGEIVGKAVRGPVGANGCAVQLVSFRVSELGSFMPKDPGASFAENTTLQFSGDHDHSANVTVETQVGSPLISEASMATFTVHLNYNQGSISATKTQFGSAESDLNISELPAVQIESAEIDELSNPAATWLELSCNQDVDCFSDLDDLKIGAVDVSANPDVLALVQQNFDSSNSVASQNHRFDGSRLKIQILTNQPEIRTVGVWLSLGSSKSFIYSTIQLSSETVEDQIVVLYDVAIASAQEMETALQSESKDANSSQVIGQSLTAMSETQENISSLMALAPYQNPAEGLMLGGYSNPWENSPVSATDPDINIAHEHWVAASQRWLTALDFAQTQLYPQEQAIMDKIDSLETDMLWAKAVYNVAVKEFERVNQALTLCFNISNAISNPCESETRALMEAQAEMDTTKREYDIAKSLFQDAETSIEGIRANLLALNIPALLAEASFWFGVYQDLLP